MPVDSFSVFCLLSAMYASAIYHSDILYIIALLFSTQAHRSGISSMRRLIES